MNTTASKSYVSGPLVPERLILASASPRRRDILAKAGYVFDVIVPPLQEPQELPGGLSPRQQAEALAFFKARSVSESVPKDLVLGADTVVAVGPTVLGKPDGPEDARRMLRTLSCSRHTVITGVALIGPGEFRRIASDVTHVTMRPLTEADVDGYVRSGEWMGKAGAYAIQETADRFILSVEGSFSNVVGLPIERVGELLSACGRLPEKRGSSR